MEKINRTIILSILGFIVTLSIFPLVLLILISFSLGWAWSSIIPTEFSLNGWKYVLFENPKTMEAIVTSFKIALSVAGINLILSIPAADALGRYDFKGKKMIESLILLPIIVPPIIFSMGIHKHFIILNLTDSLIGVIISHIIITLPYMIRAITISFAHLGFELEEQAKMLGAKRMYRLFHVVFPFILPGIVAGGSITILVSLSQYIITLLIGGGNIVTLPVLMYPYINGGDQSIGAVYSILFGIMAVISLLVIDSFLKRYYDGRKVY